EADGEAGFAAAVLDLVYVRVRDVGNVFRVVRNTVGGLAGGSIKAVGAGLHGLSSVLDAVSRTVEPKPEVPVEESSPGRSTSSSPDPFDRISSMARSSLAGSLKLLSASTRGVGDAVIQAGTVVEELTGGTGQVAEDVVREVQGAVGRARDDALKSGTQATASSKSTSAGDEDAETTSATAPGAMRVWKLCREGGAFALVMLEEALREVVGLFRGKN
ncbi:unnamed protein product, partial [Ascophyllum nodosum]